MIRLDDGDVSRLLPARRQDSHKGTYGKTLVIAGSRNMAGAALLAARAALHTGCGMVKVVTEECNRVIIQTAFPEALLSTYIAGELDGPALIADLRWADAVVIGPGLGTGDTARALVGLVFRQAEIPILADADALNIIAGDPSLFDGAKAGVVITPHLVEMTRLCGRTLDEVRADREGTALSFAAAHGLTCVLKDARTVIATRNGSVYENTSGNHGMSTAGSGDVLAGIVGSLMAQGLSAAEAAPLGVYLHGRAGDFAAAALSPRFMTAGDIDNHLQAVFMNLEMSK